MLIRRPATLIDRVFEDWNRALNDVASAYTLALDVHETESGYVITTELPGVSSDSIDVRVHDDVLTISAENRNEKSDNQQHLLLQERRYGKFSRSVRFPVHVNADGIEAHFENGVLSLNIPKSEEVKPRRIAINAKNN